MSIFTRRVAGGEHSPRRFAALLALLVLAVGGAGAAVALRPQADEPMVLLSASTDRIERPVRAGQDLDPITLEAVGNVPARVQVQVLPATHDQTGKTSLVDTAAGRRAAREAVQVLTPSVTVKPGGKAQVRLRAGRAGSASDRGFYGMLRLHYRLGGERGELRRINMLVLLRFDGKLTRKLTVSEVTGAPGGVTVTVANDGNWLERPQAQVTVDGARRRTGSADVVLPGRRRPVYLPLAGVRAGEHRVAVTVDGRTARATVNVSELPEGQR